VAQVAAVAWVGSLAQELPHVTGSAKRKKERKEGRKEGRKEERDRHNSIHPVSPVSKVVLFSAFCS